MTYEGIIKEAISKFKGDEATMWGSISDVSEMLEEIRDTMPKLYWGMLRRTHVRMHGRHFNKEFAMWQVSKMHHKGADGRDYEGEHWTIEQTNEVFAKYRGKIPSAYNEWDFYVALNAQYHDYCAWAKRKFTENQDAEIIEMAIAFWFNDEDWPGQTKVWDYFDVVNKRSMA